MRGARPQRRGGVVQALGQDARSPTEDVLSAPARKLLNEAFALFNAGRALDALSRFREARAAGGDPVQSITGEAHSLHTLGRPREALSVLRSLVAEHPEAPAGWLGLASVLRLERRDAEAARILERAVARHREDPILRKSLLELLRARALAEKTAGRSESAARAWRRALALDPECAEARAQLAEHEALLALGRSRRSREAGRPAQAVKVLRAALRRGVARELLSSELIDLERPHAAVVRDETRARALEDARIAREEGRLARALELLRPLSVDDPQARRELEAVELERVERLVAARRWAVAERAAEALARTRPASPGPVAFCLAELRARRGDVGGQRAALTRALKELATSNTRAAGLERFRLLVALGRYPEAFVEGEKVLDAGLELADYRALWYPWRAGLLEFERERHLRLLDELSSGFPATPWALYLRGFVSRDAAELPYLLRLREYPSKRYGWMRFKLGWALLHAARFEEAADELATVTRRRDCDWRAHGFLAEALLCLGREKAAFAALEAGARRAPEKEKADARCWRGALELWLGRYRSAFKHLDAACSAGARWALCWRGAALLKMGRLEEGLADVTRAQEFFPDDGEAAVWRAEALLALRRWPQARLAAAGAKGLWGTLVRARIHAETGRNSDMRAEFDGVPAPVRRRLAAAVGLAEVRAFTDEQIRRQLDEAYRLARGFRCERSYGNVIWMR